MGRSTAHLYAVFPIKSMESNSVLAQPSDTQIAPIQRVLNLGKKTWGRELEAALRENDLSLCVSYRCASRNNQGWRCGRPVMEPNTKCEHCREGSRRRDARYWPKRIIRDSIKKDQMALTQQKFVRCENCNTPSLFRKPKRKHGVSASQDLSCWCQPCRRKRRLAQCRAFYRENGAYKNDCVYRSMVNVSANSDKGKFQPDYDYRSHTRYITTEDLKKMRRGQRNKCWFCDCKMNSESRKGNDGLTIERLDDGPHWSDTCVMSCLWCNRRSWREKWCPYPRKLAKILGYTVVGGYLEGEEDGTKWTYLDGTKQWIPNGTSQYKLPSRLPSRLCVKRMGQLLEELRLTPHFASCQ